MGRRYVRDARGRFASSGYSGQTGGRGARLKAKNSRAGGGAKITAARPKSSVAKPRGLKPDRWISKQRVIGKGEVWVGRYRNPGLKARKEAAVKAKSKVSDARVSRVIGRVNSVVRGADAKSGVKRLNAIEVGQRAKSFLARKAGGISAINGMGQAESFASVRKAMTKPPRYSTTKPNRNKPGAYNNLGQSSARAKARAAAMTPQQRIQQSNAAKAKPVPVASRSGRRGIGNRALQLPPPRVPGYVSGRRVAGTIAKRGTTAKPAVSSTVARTRKQAIAAQSYRRNEVLGRTRSRNARNAGLKRRDTGMRQLSLAGPSKKLYSYKPTQLRRK